MILRERVQQMAPHRAVPVRGFDERRVGAGGRVRDSNAVRGRAKADILIHTVAGPLIIHN
jgi:hypothetical protein